MQRELLAATSAAVTARRRPQARRIAGAGTRPKRAPAGGGRRSCPQRFRSTADQRQSRHALSRTPTPMLPECPVRCLVVPRGPAPGIYVEMPTRAKRSCVEIRTQPNTSPATPTNLVSASSHLAALWAFLRRASVRKITSRCTSIFQSSGGRRLRASKLERR